MKGSRHAAQKKQEMDNLNLFAFERYSLVTLGPNLDRSSLGHFSLGCCSAGGQTRIEETRGGVWEGCCRSAWPGGPAKDALRVRRRANVKQARQATQAS